jgi:hypothetical protein
MISRRRILRPKLRHGLADDGREGHQASIVPWEIEVGKIPVVGAPAAHVTTFDVSRRLRKASPAGRNQPLERIYEQILRSTTFLYRSPLTM